MEILQSPGLQMLGPLPATKQLTLAGLATLVATVQEVIRGLTERFSLAFMTTVIGLPTSALLRALLSISGAWVLARDKQPEETGA